MCLSYRTRAHKMKDGLPVVALPPLSRVVANDTTRQTFAGARDLARADGCGWIFRSTMFVLAILGSAGCGGASDEPVETDVTLQTSTAIFGGSRDDDRAAFGSVVALKVGRAGAFELCSGALVAPNVVLTARHCVANCVTTTVSCDENGHSTNGIHVSGELSAELVTIYTGASPRFTGRPDAVGKIVVAPKSDYLCDSDIALVVLDRSLTDVAPMAVRLVAQVSPGETIRSIGYGQNDERIPLGTRLRKDNVAVLAKGKGVSESKTALGPHEFEVGRSICQGDSGGPAISETTGAVLGVVSRGGNCDDDYGHIYTTTAGWKDLFDEAFAQAGSAPINEPMTVTAGSGPLASPAAAAPSKEGTSTESCAFNGTPGTSSGTSSALLLILAMIARIRRARHPLHS